jgi:hypothetical protein
MPKTIHSKRNPLTNDQRHRYRANLIIAQAIREVVKELVPTTRYTRVYTEAQADGVCRMKLYNIHYIQAIPHIINVLNDTPCVIKVETVSNSYGRTESVAFKVNI